MPCPLRSRWSLVMRRVTLTQFLIEQQRAGCITADLRLLIEVVARAVKAISVNVSKGAFAGVLRRGRHRQRPGRGAEEARRLIANEILLQANEVGGHLPAWRREVETICQIPSTIPRRLPAAVRSARRLVRTSTSTSRSAPSSRCCATADGSEPTEERLPAARSRAGRRRLCGLWPQHELVLTGARHPRLHRSTARWAALSSTPSPS